MKRQKHQSQHLRKMKDGNMVESRKTGQTILYSIKAEQVKLLQPFFKIIAQMNIKPEMA